jgi:fructose-1,6-bisphosphatase/inositol monophosphatase family enzyme
MRDEVGGVLRRAARTAVLPRFQHLAAGDVHEKAPGELVTVADREAERIIAAGLRDLLPGSAVVGEEGVAADPALTARLRDAGPVWLVDPIDGTSNFAAGREPFVMMVALLRERVTEAAWILDPRTGSLAYAGRGGGAYLDGARVRSDTGERPGPGALRGVVTSRYLPPRLRPQVRQGAEKLGERLPGLHCAGREYLRLVEGGQDYVLFWSTQPWDHAPGLLITEEAGGVVRQLDGGRYDPADPRRGLLAAATESIWNEVHATLFP